MTKNKTLVGIIGGSGLDNPQILKSSKQFDVDTPFGKPASKITKGKIGTQEVAILGRHGHNHHLSPSLVPYQANIWSLKELGCTHILATTACGSLTEEMKPGDLVFLDQFIDFTKNRLTTFFTDKVVHTPMANPFDSNLRSLLIQSAQKLKLPYHPTGTIITIEGPRFSTRAESLMFRSWGAQLINMSTVPEVTLANELSIPYQSIAMVTDYDCWKENEESVTFDLILKRMADNAQRVQELLVKTVSNLSS